MRFFLFFLVLITTPHAQESPQTCTPNADLEKRTVQILREGRGVGSGVLLDNTHILTAHHVLKNQPNDRIWIRTPHNTNHLIRSSITAISPQADLTLLTLHPTPTEALPPLNPLTLTSLQPGQDVRHVGYAFGQLHRLGTITGTYKGPQRTSHQPDIASHVTLNAPAYGGDSGGPLFTCNGNLAGIEFGNRAPEGLPQEAYFITPQSIQALLKNIE